MSDRSFYSVQILQPELMVEVFKTSVRNVSEAEFLVALLSQHFPESKISIDLDDCDKVLRLEGLKFNPEYVINLVQNHGICCQVLE